MGVKIITDSAADLPVELLQAYDIDLIPLRVYDEAETEYLDGVTLESVTLLQKMREGAVYRTSLPSLETFQEKFVSYAKEGNPCIYLAFSSELSGTYQSSVVIKEEVKETYANLDLEIIDTKCASLGQGLVVLEAAKMAKDGASKEDILKRVDFLMSHMEHIFTVADLQYLVRGGRLSKVAGFIGGLLNIKPILNVEEGKLVPLEKVRGKKKVLSRIVDIMEERGKDLKGQTIGMTHGDDLETAEALKSLITERFGCEVFIVNTIGAAIGAHTGPGVITLFFLNEVE
ncbi:MULTISPECIES: DegV family protein [Bacillus]|jgi:DegV family protein with EDD domain|uniref:DegV family protein n=14 Tax=Bacillus cereus group TaxID=86661 RepID=Q81CA4_BACCR|nr:MULTISPECIES: DegV family protein [Bacillus]MBJ6722307.1 DegV family protein [Bacillus sp. PR5]MCO4217769.1 DegV family protein [Bacillus sp. 10017]MCX2703311.1 DegV family protein [Bacillus sp. AS_5]MEB4842260.1 DegV family protein [Paenibacillus jamilae]TKV45391.1 DegV family protein [Bacillus sp. PIC28]CJA05376.1 DegV family protein in cluster with TrmH family tRNA/rRNA methyltransferase YacO [Streptococcus pneumoniae]HCX48622.1 DegV family protein [Bacillus sp. (in: firmicutes)]